MLSVLIIEVWFEPTSVPKAVKVANTNYLKKIKYISPNRKEINAIVEHLRPDLSSLCADDGVEAFKKKAEILVNSGVENVVLKMGPHGALLASKKLLFPEMETVGDVYFKKYDAEKVEDVINVTGAGDSLDAGVLYGILKGLSMDESMKIGLKAAKLSLESEFAVSPKIGTLKK